MQNYLPLDLEVKLKPIDLAEIVALISKITYTIRRPDVLADETLQRFKSLGFEVSCVGFFGGLKSLPYPSLVHFDVTRKPETYDQPIKPSRKHWNPCTYAVNFELTGTTSQFYWHDVGITVPTYPELPSVKEYLSYETARHHWPLHGAHFERGTNFPILQQTSIGAKPVLVRTDVAHSVSYKSEQPRVLCSVRFKEELSWEEAYSRFVVGLQGNDPCSAD